MALTLLTFIVKVSEHFTGLSVNIHSLHHTLLPINALLKPRVTMLTSLILFCLLLPPQPPPPPLLYSGTTITAVLLLLLQEEMLAFK